MRKISRRSFLASSVKAALFSGVGGLPLKVAPLLSQFPGAIGLADRPASLLAAMTSAAKTSSAVC